MIDFDALVFGPVYDTFGQPAVLTIASSNYDLMVIDNTKGVTIDEGTAIGVQTSTRPPMCGVVHSTTWASSLPI